jgi:hypothetical protein
MLRSAGGTCAKPQMGAVPTRGERLKIDPQEPFLTRPADRRVDKEAVVRAGFPLRQGVKWHDGGTVHGRRQSNAHGTFLMKKVERQAPLQTATTQQRDSQRARKRAG